MVTFIPGRGQNGAEGAAREKQTGSLLQEGQDREYKTPKSRHQLQFIEGLHTLLKQKANWQRNRIISVTHPARGIYCHASCREDSMPRRDSIPRGALCSHSGFSPRLSSPFYTHFCFLVEVAFMSVSHSCPPLGLFTPSVCLLACFFSLDSLYFLLLLKNVFYCSFSKARMKGLFSFQFSNKVFV